MRKNNLSFAGSHPSRPAAARPSRWAAMLTLIALVTIVFWPVLGHEFINCDDGTYVVDNHHVTAGISAEGVRWAFTTQHASNWHPLTWISHQLDAEIFGLRPAGHHLVSLLLHALATLLLYLVLDGMTLQPVRSLAAVSLFAVHPLHVESIAWVAERKDVLSACFFLLTLHLYLRYARRPTSAGYGAVLAAFALGLMAKPMLVTLPFVLLLLDRWPLGRWRRDGVAARRGRGALLVEKVPLMFLSAASAAATFAAQRGGDAMANLTDLPLWPRLTNAIHAPVVYILKTLLPVDLAPFYPLKTGGPGPLVAVLSFAALAAVTALALSRLSSQPCLAAGWFWYLGMLVPVVGLVQVGSQSIADRYTYLPSVGLFIAICWALPDFGGSRFRRWLPAASAVGVAVLAVLGFFQVRRWKDSATLFSHAIVAVPGNYLAHNNLGLALRSAGRQSEAASQFREAIRINPTYPEPHFNLGNILLGEGLIQEAVREYGEATRYDPGLPGAWYGLGLALERAGREIEAADAFRRAVQLDPRHSASANNLGAISARLGKLDEATGWYREAIKNDPGNAAAHYNLAVVLERQGAIQEAVGHFRRAALLDQNDADSRRALLRLGGQ